MSTAALDRLLAVLVAAQLGTGLLSLRAGTPSTAPLFVVHGLLGGALLAAVLLKVRRSVPRAWAARRWLALAVAVLLGLTTTAALAGGFVWVASGRILSLGPWTVLTLHVFAALALVPFAVIHLLPRRWRVIRPPRRAAAAAPLISRRTALTTLAFGLVGLATWAGAEALDRVAGGVRRFTGSRWLPDGGIPPATTFFGEGTQPLSRGGWRLRVHGAVDRPLELSLDELAALGETAREEVLDCTSGWALRTTWGGVPLASVLDAAGAAAEGTVTVRAVTGWYAALPMDEARGAFLATAVAGRPLPHGNGAPCRLVAPNRRGLEWVKWVTEVEVA